MMTLRFGSRRSAGPRAGRPARSLSAGRARPNGWRAPSWPSPHAAPPSTSAGSSTSTGATCRGLQAAGTSSGSTPGCSTAPGALSPPWRRSRVLLRRFGAEAVAVALLTLVLAVLAVPAGAKVRQDFVGETSDDVLRVTPAYREATLRQQAADGIGLIRQTFWWSEIERSPGKFVFGAYDR